MLVCYLKVLATGVGRLMGVIIWCSFLHIVIPCIMYDIIMGAALLCSPQLERYFLIFSHV